MNKSEKNSNIFKGKNSQKNTRTVSLFSFTRFSVKQQTFFAKRLSFLIKAGVPLIESMYVIKKQTKSKSELRLFDKVISGISNGQSLAASLEHFNNDGFGNFAINIIRAGESSGMLTENLNYLAEELKKKQILKKKIMSAMLYPIIITIATFGITGFLALYIFPKILPIFQSLNAKLPFPTRVVMYLTDVLRHDGIYIFLGLAMLVIGTAISIGYVPKIRFFYHGLLLRIPFAGKIAKHYNLTNTTRTLGLLVKSNLPLHEALILTSDTTENLQYKNAFADIAKNIMEGKNMSLLIGSYPNLFPSMLEHMIGIGERSGNLSNTLLYLSEFYENEFDDLTKNLSNIIEPVLMIIMGLMIGFIAVSVITPIYEITNNLKR